MAAPVQGNVANLDWDADDAQIQDDVKEALHATVDSMSDASKPALVLVSNCAIRAASNATKGALNASMHSSLPVLAPLAAPIIDGCVEISANAARNYVPLLVDKCVDLTKESVKPALDKSVDSLS